MGKAGDWGKGRGGILGAETQLLIANRAWRKSPVWGLKLLSLKAKGKDCKISKMALNWDPGSLNFYLISATKSDF